MSIARGARPSESPPGTTVSPAHARFKVIEGGRGADDGGPRLVDGRSYVAESFATIYVVVVWFGDGHVLGAERDERALVREALPRLAKLVVDLPPPDAPVPTAGAARARVPRIR